MLNIIIDVMNLLEMLFLIYKKVVGKYYFPTTQTVDKVYKIFC